MLGIPLLLNFSLWLRLVFRILTDCGVNIFIHVLDLRKYIPRYLAHINRVVNDLPILNLGPVTFGTDWLTVIVPILPSDGSSTCSLEG